MSTIIINGYTSSKSALKVINWLFRMVIIIFSLQFLFACKKDSKDESKLNLSFTYNDKKYNLGPLKTDANGSPLSPTGGSVGAFSEWLFGDDYLWINRPDIFNGIIKFNGAGCTFFYPVPTNRLDVYNFFDNCQPNLTSQTLDSNAVYFYKSGFTKVRKENCRSVNEQDWGGGFVVRTMCDFYGSFELELINKQGKTIKLSNGLYQRLKSVF